MSTEPLWRGKADARAPVPNRAPVIVLPDDLRDTEVEVWRAGDRTSPTREQIEQAKGAAAFLFHTLPHPGDDNRLKAYRDVKAVLDAV